MLKFEHQSILVVRIKITALVCMWAALPKNYKTESNNMFRNLSVMALLPQNVIFQFANANIPPSQQLKFNLSRMIRLDFHWTWTLDFTFAMPAVNEPNKILVYSSKGSRTLVDD